MVTALTYPESNAYHPQECVSPDIEEWTYDEIVKSELEVRIEFLQPDIKQCRLCNRAEFDLMPIFNNAGEPTVNSEWLHVVHLLASVQITFEKDGDSMVCGFCCQKMEELCAIREIWQKGNIDATEQRQIEPSPAITPAIPMTWIPREMLSSIKQESIVNGAIVATPVQIDRSEPENTVQTTEAADPGIYPGATKPVHPGGTVGSLQKPADTARKTKTIEPDDPEKERLIQEAIRLVSRKFTPVKRLKKRPTRKCRTLPV
ncbi:uncharacterized protein LOC128272218 [Anopheles cruzii]|uniref:uncharacterized protein LOC128272218 n=1 Tax=Anopheles cruzii TaxID=68878 RepID=UPI0022EC3077|nr:uncharacterized protein LOC128272218 [Anopheles cruzii]